MKINGKKSSYSGGTHHARKAHDGPTLESKKNVLISREMRIFSAELGITGICDVVEFRKCPANTEGAVSLFGHDGYYQVIPVEYKKGEPKVNDADRLQLVAQAMCLEEMLCTEIKRDICIMAPQKDGKK